MTEKEIEILAFLAEFKYLISKSSFYIINRKINRDALVELETTETQRLHYLTNLIKDDYSEGPLQDDIRGGHVWVFGKNVNSKEIYIKLTINTYNGKHAVCISFHCADRPLSYPYK